MLKYLDTLVNARENNVSVNISYLDRVTQQWLDSKLKAIRTEGMTANVMYLKFPLKEATQSYYL